MSTPAPASTPWVPMWSLQGGVSLSYLGAWVAGTYQPGQVVVDKGISYVCTRQTTKRPTVWPSSNAASYGTTLPASPQDGQEAVLVDSVTNPTYTWRFRYNASSSSAYKWEFVGGSEWISTDEADVSTTSVYPAMVLIGTLGVFIIPRSGEYIVTWSVNYYNTVAAIYGYHALFFNASNTGLIFYHNNPTAGVWVTVGSRSARPVLTAGGQIDLRHATGSGTGHFGQRSLTIKPVRVS